MGSDETDSEQDLGSDDDAPHMDVVAKEVERGGRIFCLRGSLAILLRFARALPLCPSAHVLTTLSHLFTLPHHRYKLYYDEDGILNESAARPMRSGPVRAL